MCRRKYLQKLIIIFRYKKFIEIQTKCTFFLNIIYKKHNNKVIVVKKRKPKNENTKKLIKTKQRKSMKYLFYIYIKRYLFIYFVK